ncbi:MAG: J domain-containing protein [Bacteroidia bacterium]
MINYYKILELENYASVEEVKLAYKNKIKTYHPDVSSDPNAEEMTKYLNQAKGQLDNEVSKEQYDKELKLAYLIEIQRLRNKPKKSYLDSIARRERKEKLEESRKLAIRDKYLKGIELFPFSLRIIGFVVLTLWSLQIVYSHYFISFGSLDYIYAMLGYVLLTITIAVGANEAYTYFLVKSMEKPIRFNYEKLIGRWFVLSFFVFVLSVNGLNGFRKYYHLNNHFEYTPAWIDMKNTMHDKVLVQYTVNGQTFARRLDGDWTTLTRLPSGHTVVKYATQDPKISELVYEDDVYQLR